MLPRRSFKSVFTGDASVEQIFPPPTPISPGEAVPTRPALPLPRLAWNRNPGRGKGNDRPHRRRAEAAAAVWKQAHNCALQVRTNHNCFFLISCSTRGKKKKTEPIILYCIEINIFRPHTHAKLFPVPLFAALPPDSLAVCGTPQFSYVCNNKFLILPR